MDEIAWEALRKLYLERRERDRSGMKFGDAVAAYERNELWDVDTQYDGCDCWAEGKNEDEVLSELALWKDPEACDEHEGGSIGYARVRRWSARRVTL